MHLNVLLHINWQLFPGLKTLLCKSSRFLLLVLCRTLMRISSLSSQSLWFWKRFSSFQMFSSRSASVDASPRVCWSSRERSDMRVTFSISTSWRCEETWERETGEGKRKNKSKRFVLGFDALIPQLRQSHQIEYHSLSVISQLGLNQHFNAEQMLT